MKFIPVLMTVLLLFSCVGDGKRTAEAERLKRYDRLLYENPYRALDSLRQMEEAVLSGPERAYYRLLYTIALVKTEKDAEAAQEIYQAERWYAKSRDYENYARALFYAAAVEDLSGPEKRKDGDTAAFARVKKAEWLIKSRGIRNPELEGMVSRYLSDVNFINKNYREAESYARKSIGAYSRLRDTLNLILGYDNLFWTMLGQGAGRLIGLSEGSVERGRQEHQRKISDRYATQYLVSAKSVWLGRKAEILRGLDALGKEEEMNFYDRSALHFALARNFEKSGQTDSALFYARLCVEDISDSLSYNSCIQYNFYAGLLSGQKDYKNACVYLEKALNALEKNRMSRQQKKILELEKKYGLAEKENEILQIRSRTNRLLWALILLAGLSAGLFFIYLQSRKNVWQSARIAAQQGEIARLNEERLLKMNIINKLLEINSGMFPAMSASAYETALKSYGSAFECAGKILDQSGELKKKAKKDLRDVLSSASIEQYIPYYKGLSVFGEKEKLIIILSDLGCSPKNIENIIQSSAGTIRSLRSRIREKLEKNKEFPGDTKRKILDLLG